MNYTSAEQWIRPPHAGPLPHRTISPDFIMAGIATYGELTLQEIQSASDCGKFAAYRMETTWSGPLPDKPDSPIITVSARVLRADELEQVRRVNPESSAAINSVLSSKAAVAMAWGQTAHDASFALIHIDMIGLHNGWTTVPRLSDFLKEGIKASVRMLMDQILDSRAGIRGFRVIVDDDATVNHSTVVLPDPVRKSIVGVSLSECSCSARDRTTGASFRLLRSGMFG